MTIQFEIDCALMAGRAYQTNRSEINSFPIPIGWAEFFHIPNLNVSTSGGFEAVSFQRGNEIVISYAGTDQGDILGDMVADAALAAGLWSTQLKQAAEYYMEVKAANPNAKITFTGHSLGGGLASLMGVFFNEKAVTFDQAPFRNAANFLIASALRENLALAYPESTYSHVSDWLDPLDKFIMSIDPLGLCNISVSGLHL